MFKQSRTILLGFSVPAYERRVPPATTQDCLTNT